MRPSGVSLWAAAAASPAGTVGESHDLAADNVCVTKGTAGLKTDGGTTGGGGIVTRWGSSAGAAADAETTLGCGQEAICVRRCSRASSTRVINAVRASSNGPDEIPRSSDSRVVAARITASGSDSCGPMPSTRRGSSSSRASMPSHCLQGSNGACVIENLRHQSNTVGVSSDLRGRKQGNPRRPRVSRECRGLYLPPDCHFGKRVLMFARCFPDHKGDVLAVNKRKVFCQSLRESSKSREWLTVFAATS